MKKVVVIIGTAVLVFIAGFGIAFLLALPTMWIWNYLIASNITVAIFGVTKLTFWKAFFLNWLCSILFKGSITFKGS